MEFHSWYPNKTFLFFSFFFCGGDWWWGYSLPKCAVHLRAWCDWKTHALQFSGTWKTFFLAAGDSQMLPDTHILCEWDSHTSSSHCVVTAWAHYKQSVHGCKNTAYHLLLDHINKSYHHFISYLVWCKILWISWTRLEQVSYLQQVFAYISNANKKGFVSFHIQWLMNVRYFNEAVEGTENSVGSIHFKFLWTEVHKFLLFNYLITCETL